MIYLQKRRIVNTLSISLAFCSLAIQAQTDSLQKATSNVTAVSIKDEETSNVTIAITVGNNGQVSSLLSDHYTPYYNFVSNSLYFQGSKSKQNASDVKFNFYVDLTSKKFTYLRLKAGFNQRTFSLFTTDRSYSYTVETRQTVTNFNIAFGRSYLLNRFNITAGLELPLFFIGNYTTDEKEEYFRSSMTTPDEVQKINSVTDGGLITGINSFLNCKFDIYKNFFACTELSFGLLNTYTGKTRTTKEDFTSYYPAQSNSSSTYTTENDLKKIYFSPPELSLGFGYKF